MPYRDYHRGLHPGGWRGWRDFGTGSLGNWGCHQLDGASWALKLGHPASIEAIRQEGGSEEKYPPVNTVRWDFPARGQMPPVKVFWYDGGSPNRPPLVAEIEKKYNLNLGGFATLYIGDKGTMYTGACCEGTRIIPEEKQQAFPPPEKTIPRSKHGFFGDFLQGCRDGQQPSANFEYSAGLTEMVLVAHLAIRAGVGKKVEWDGPNMRVTNISELNQYVKRDYRKGWTL